MSEPKPTEEEPSEKAEEEKSPDSGANGVGARTDEADDADKEEKDEPAADKSGPTAKADDKKDDAPDIVPRGNPFRWKRGLLTIFGGGAPALLLMAKNGQNAWAFWLGFACCLVASWGVMDLLGTFDDADDHVAARTTGGALTVPLVRMGAVAIAFAGALAAAQASLGPWWVSSLTVTGTFIGLVACVFDVGSAIGPWRTDEVGEARPLHRRHGFWVLVVGAVLYFPALGLYSLWDPWETHYGEVAREILSRDDWISLWWAQDGWFWSKPILNFWIQSLSMGALGTHFHPDQMLMAGGQPVAHPEWVLRTPNVLMTLVAMYLLYKGVAKVFGRRAGLLGAVVLATMPDWFFLAHQTMTDMPFVSAMTAAMGLLLLGLNTDEEERIKVYEIDAFGVKWRVSLWHLVVGVVLLCCIPQILYLLSRNIELVVFGDGPKGFRIHWDEFRSGSAGNCGLPGNEACILHSPTSVPKSVSAIPSGFGPSMVRYFGGFEPSLQAIVWGVVLGGFLWLQWGERRARRLIYVGAWLAAAIATMAKGPAGFGLPMICAFAYVATKKRWGELLRFEMMAGLLLIFCVALPWYVAMYVRHGSPFTDRLIFHDMFNRAFSHVHDTNEGDDTGVRYYVWQLGYALFPWTGLAPLGLLWGFRRSDSALFKKSAVGDASVMLVMWFLFAFALFTFMGTKFHHYIFPAVPPVAMLLGVLLDDVLGDRPLVKRGQLPMYMLGLAVSAAVTTYGFARLWDGGIWGTSKSHASLSLAIVIAGLGIAGAVIVARRSAEKSDDDDAGAWHAGMRLESDEEAKRRSAHDSLMLGGAAVLGALVTALVGRDLALKPEGPADQPGAIRLLHLFTYNYRRPWPDTLDFSAILGGFAVVVALVAFAIAVKSIRRHALAAFCAVAFVWALWGLDVYMVETAPHWGQHEVIEAYYKDRQSPEEMLIAYQMNWKGENIYTGNRIPAFVSSGANFQTWLKQQRDKGVKVLYFVTEHTRTGGLKSEVNGKSYKEITDKALCNKFVLVRIEI